MVSECVYLLNTYIKNDAGIKTLFGGTSPNIYPILVDAPATGTQSYPYIRYITTPGFNDGWRVREDLVQYYIGDNDVVTIGQIMERMIKLTQLDNYASLAIGDSQYKIQSVVFERGISPRTPDQENGVIERGFVVRLIYAILS